MTIYAQDTEGGLWSALEHWNAVLLRVYTHGGDAFGPSDITAEGLSGETSNTVTWSLAGVAAPRLLPLPDLSAAPSVVSTWRLEVSVVNLDGVESTPVVGDLVNT